jgi:hypothetical protein
VRAALSLDGRAAQDLAATSKRRLIPGMGNSDRARFAQMPPVKAACSVSRILFLPCQILSSCVVNRQPREEPFEVYSLRSFLMQVSSLDFGPATSRGFFWAPIEQPILAVSGGNGHLGAPDARRQIEVEGPHR